MIWKYDYKTIQGARYIHTVRLISEKGKPDWILEEATRKRLDLQDGSGALQWQIIANNCFDPSMNPNEENRPYVFRNIPQVGKAKKQIPKIEELEERIRDLEAKAKGETDGER